MSDWRDEILNEFVPEIHAVTATADPDGLLMEPRLSQSLDDKGFELLVYEDSVSFRFAYESRFRPRIDSGKPINLIVLTTGDEDSLNKLPFDVLAKARSISFSLAKVFPHLSYSVLRDLETQYVDQVYDAQGRFKPGELGDNATKDFILRHVFEIAAELIKSDADLIRTLLRRHYRVQSIPRVLVNRLVQLLSQNGHFAKWPLAALFEERSLFYAFLQERWPIFLDKLGASATASAISLSVEGPADVPFDDSDVRVYIDNLFVEGLLQPVEWDCVPQGWAAVGVRQDAQYTRDRQLGALLDIAERELPGNEARYGEWISFARIWAEVNSLASTPGAMYPLVLRARFSLAQTHVDSSFAQWLPRRIGSLSSLPARPPVMVHHIARYLSMELEFAGKIALIVLDGLAYDQWLDVQRELNRQRPDLRFDESAVFGWVPTITSVSRQSIFAGRAPLFFPSSIYSTGREPALWEQFWSDHGLGAHEIAFLKGLGDPATLNELDVVLAQPKTKIIGAVVDKVDRIMHGMELGAVGMHNQVHQWATEGFLSVMVDMLLSKGFTVFFTADHGNVESVGCGRPKEGVTAEIRGERARIYSDPVLRAAVADKFPAAISWKPIGLPEDFLPLLSAGRTAFVSEGTRTVAHGGVTLEEAIVPFVRIIGGKS